MKTDSNSQRLIAFMIILIVAALLLFIIAKRPAMAHSSNVVDSNVELQMQHDNIRHMTEEIRAYRKVLHRVWIDRPNYVEDALCEMDEYIDLEQFLDEDALKEIFSFYSEQDSVEYKHNWFHEGEPVMYKSPLE